MDDLISRQAAFEVLCNATFRCAYIDVCKKGDRYCEEGTKLDEVPSAQPDKDMIHLQKKQAYMQGWEDGRKALREEIWEDGRDRLD